MWFTACQLSGQFKATSIANINLQFLAMQGNPWKCKTEITRAHVQRPERCSQD